MNLENNIRQVVYNAQQALDIIALNPSMSPAEKELHQKAVLIELYGILQNIDSQRRGVELVDILNSISKSLDH